MPSTTIPDEQKHQKMQQGSEKSFKTRAPVDEPGTMRTNDDIHSTIRLCPATKTIIDTPQMQRLRGLKQLGTAELVYTTATHTRFEHSLGVGHLAEKKLRGIKERQPRLRVTEMDVLCVKIAGLLHDLGHGPFSHVYDGLFRAELKKASSRNNHLYNDVPLDYRKMMDGWKHEDASLSMIDALLKHLGLEIDDSDDGLDKPLRQIGDGIDAERFGIYGYKQEDDYWYDGVDKPLPPDFVLTSRDWIFIKECIAGGPLPPKGMSIKAAKSSGRKLEIVGRKGKNKEYLYDIISNVHSGLDVDKMDYFSRDGCRTATGESAFNDFLLENAYVAKGLCESPEKCWKCNGKTCKESYHLMICYQSPKTINTAMSFFRQRFNNYKNIYEHHKTRASSYMISDILALADPYYRLPGSKLPISLAMCNPDAYCMLKDSIIDIIQLTDDDNLQPAKELIQRYRSRKLYKSVFEQPIPANVDWAQNLWQMDEENIAQEIVNLSENILCRSDIIVEKSEMNFGKKDENPVSHMRFLPKSLLTRTREKPELLPVAIKVNESNYECDASKSYNQRSIRVYYKQLDDNGCVSLKDCFNSLIDKVKSECTQHSYDDTGSLIGSSIDFSANVNICTQSPIKSDVEESPFVMKTKKRRKCDNSEPTLFKSAIERIG